MSVISWNFVFCVQNHNITLLQPLFFMDKLKFATANLRSPYPKQKILQRVAEVAAQINNDLKNENPLFFLAVLNGSFVFAADLMRCMEMPCEISFVRMASYEGTSSTGKVKQLIGLKRRNQGTYRLS